MATFRPAGKDACVPPALASRTETPIAAGDPRRAVVMRSRVMSTTRDGRAAVLLASVGSGVRGNRILFAPGDRGD